MDHYFKVSAHRVITEFNISRNGLSLRLDHSTALRLAMDGIPLSAREDLKKLSFTENDFTTKIDFSQPKSVYVLSLLADQWVSVYKHKSTGILIPFFINAENGMLNLCALSPSERAQLAKTEHAKAALDTLAIAFDYYGSSLDWIFKDNLHYFLSRIHESSRVFLIKSKEFYGSQITGKNISNPALKFNGVINKIKNSYPHVETISPTDFVLADSEIKNDNHYDRMVYFRMFDRIFKSTNNLNSF